MKLNLAQMAMPSSMSTAPSTKTAVATGVAAAAAAGVLWKAVSSKKSRYPNRVELLEFEAGMLGRGTAPVTTLTWFEGPEYSKLVPILRERIKIILKANPWLQGTFETDNGKAYMAYPHYKSVDDFLVVHKDDDAGKSPVVYGRPIAEVSESILKHSTNGGNLVLEMFRGYQQPFWRVAVVPCQERPTTHFAVVVSMSHVVGDGHTFYKLYEQLLHNNDNEVPALVVDRIHNTFAMQEEYMRNEVNVLHSLGFIGCMVRGVFEKALAKSRLFGRMMFDKSKSPPDIKSPYEVETKCVLLDVKRIEDAKRKAMKEQMEELKEDAPTSNTKPVDFVSTNDVLTSWLLTASGCSHGLMALNFRDRIDNHTDELAGNYENCLLYYPPFDTSNPTLIRQSLEHRRRVSTTTREFSSWELAKSDLALVTNWATFAPFRKQGKSLILPDCQQLFHVPAGDYNSMVPSTLASCVIFQATSDQIGLLVTANACIMDNLKEVPFATASEKSF